MYKLQKYFYVIDWAPENILLLLGPLSDLVFMNEARYWHYKIHAPGGIEPL